MNYSVRGNIYLNETDPKSWRCPEPTWATSRTAHNPEKTPHISNTHGTETVVFWHNIAWLGHGCGRHRLSRQAEAT